MPRLKRTWIFQISIFRGLWKISAMLSDFSRIEKNKKKSTSQTKDQECVSTCSCSVCNKKQCNARDHLIQLIEFSQKRIIWTVQCQNLKHQENTYPTCRTGLETRYFSRKALGAMSYMIEVARCAKMLSIVCLGCCLRITIVMIVMMINDRQCPPGDPEVLLKRSRQRRKDGLGRLVAIEGRWWTWKIIRNAFVTNQWQSEIYCNESFRSCLV